MNFGDMHGTMAILAMIGLGLAVWSRRRGPMRPATALRVGLLGARGAVADEPREVERLTAENERLTGKLGRLEERLAVLERIATDPAERTAREIDRLRDRAN